MHGVRGRIIARIFNVLPQSEIPLETELLFGDNRIESVQESSVRDTETVFLSLSNIENVEKAAELKGKPIYMARETALGLPGFLPVHLFIGMMLNSNDRKLPVVDVYPDSTNPLLLAEGTEGIFPIPLTMVFDLGTIDWESDSIHLQIPSGMEQNTGDWN